MSQRSPTRTDPISEYNLVPDARGKLITKFGSGTTFCNRWTIAAFAQSFKTYINAKSLLIAFNISGSGVRDIAIYTAKTIAGETRFIDSSIPLSYVSAAVISGYFECALYLKTLNKNECQVICLDQMGCEVSAKQYISYKFKKPDITDKMGCSHLGSNWKVDPDKILDDCFINSMKTTLYPTGLDLIECSQLSFVHTAYHGSTAMIFEKCTIELGLHNIYFVDEESDPTDKAIDLLNNLKTIKAKAEAIAQQNNASIIIAHNSDGTRIVVFETDGNKFEAFTREELAILLAWWSILVYKFQKEYERKKPENRIRKRVNFESMPLIFDSGLTLFDQIAQKEQLFAPNHLEEDSHILEQISTHLVESRQIIVPKEDEVIKLPVPLLLAVGKENQFMCDPEIIPVWDGIGAALHVIEIAIYVKAVTRSTLRDHLNALKTIYQI